MKRLITLCKFKGHVVAVPVEVPVEAGAPGITAAIQLEQAGYEPPFIHFSEQPGPAGTFCHVALNHQQPLDAAFAGLVREIERAEFAAQEPPPPRPQLDVVSAEPVIRWDREFDAGYAVPDEIVRLCRRGQMEDVSWHNDAMPSFDFWNPRTATGFKVWVDHPQADQREFDQGKRFAVYPLLPDGPADANTGQQAYQMAEVSVLMTDDEEQLLDWVGAQMHGLKEGQRVEVVNEIDRYPHCIVGAGARGTVTTVEGDLVGVTLDEPHAGLADWDNEVQFTGEDLWGFQQAGKDATFDPKQFQTIGDVVRWHCKVEEITPTAVGS